MRCASLEGLKQDRSPHAVGEKPKPGQQGFDVGAGTVHATVRTMRVEHFLKKIQDTTELRGCFGNPGRVGPPDPAAPRCQVAGQSAGGQAREHPGDVRMAVAACCIGRPELG